MAAGNNVLVLGLTLLLFADVSSAAPYAVSPAKIVSGFFSNAISAAMKWMWSLQSTTIKTAISGRPMMRFESGYNVETVFDGSKLGVEPYSVEVLSSGELLILDSANSNIYRISTALSIYSRPKLVAGSPEGYSGHVDGKPREARLNHPKGVTVDDKGNIYVADTDNMVIRKISDTGVTTIAGGKSSRGGGHVDGPSEDARFSNDFDVVYVGSSCSLLVIDRGNKAIREIQLHFDDCVYQYGNGFPIGVAVLVAAGFFGYMLALLQRRVGSMVSSQEDEETMRTDILASPYQKPLKSVRPPLIPTEDEVEKQEGFLASIVKLLSNTGLATAEILGGVFHVFRKKPLSNVYQNQQQHSLQQRHSSGWPLQESYVIPDEDEPPSIDTRTPTPRKTYPFMTKDSEKIQQIRQSRAFYSGWDDDLRDDDLRAPQQQQQHHHNQQQQQQQQQRNHYQQKHQHHHRHHSSMPHTVYEQSSETNEIMFGAVQEQESRHGSVVIKPVNYGNPMYDHQHFRTRVSYTGYGYGPYT